MCVRTWASDLPGDRVSFYLKSAKRGDKWPLRESALISWLPGKLIVRLFRFFAPIRVERGVVRGGTDRVAASARTGLLSGFFEPAHRGMAGEKDPEAFSARGEAPPGSPCGADAHGAALRAI